MADNLNIPLLAEGGAQPVETHTKDRTSTQEVLSQVSAMYDRLREGTEISGDELAEIVNGYEPILGDLESPVGMSEVFAYVHRRLPYELLLPQQDGWTISFSTDPEEFMNSSCAAVSPARHRWHRVEESHITFHIRSETDLIEIVTGMAMLEHVKSAVRSGNENGRATQALLERHFQDTAHVPAWADTPIRIRQDGAELPSAESLSKESETARSLAEMIAREVEDEEQEYMSLFFFNSFGLPLLLSNGQLLNSYGLETGTALPENYTYRQYIREEASAALKEILKDPDFTAIQLSDTPVHVAYLAAREGHIVHPELDDELDRIRAKYSHKWELIRLGARLSDIQSFIDNLTINGKPEEFTAKFDTATLEQDLLMARFILRYSGTDPILLEAREIHEAEDFEAICGIRTLVQRESSPTSEPVQIIDFRKIDSAVQKNCHPIVRSMIQRMAGEKRVLVVLPYMLGELTRHVAVETARRIPVRELIEVGKEGVADWGDWFMLAGMLGAPTHVSSVLEPGEVHEPRNLAAIVGYKPYSFTQQQPVTQTTVPAVHLYTTQDVRNAMMPLEIATGNRERFTATIGMEGLPFALASEQLRTEGRPVKLSVVNYVSDYVGRRPGDEEQIARGELQRITRSLGPSGTVSMCFAVINALDAVLTRE